MLGGETMLKIQPKTTLESVRKQTRAVTKVLWSKKWRIYLFLFFSRSSCSCGRTLSSGSPEHAEMPPLMPNRQDNHIWVSTIKRKTLPNHSSVHLRNRIWWLQAVEDSCGPSVWTPMSQSWWVSDMLCAFVHAHTNGWPGQIYLIIYELAPLLPPADMGQCKNVRHTI